MNGTPLVPEAVNPLVITGAGGRIVIVKVSESVPPEFMALMVPTKVPLAEGTPESIPEDAL